MNEVDDIADVAQQVFEVQLPFTRTAGTDESQPPRGGPGGHGHGHGRQPDPGSARMKSSAMQAMEQLARERTRGNLELAERLRHSRRRIAAAVYAEPGGWSANAGTPHDPDLAPFTARAAAQEWKLPLTV